VRDEEKWMRMAISLARRGEGRVSPNPMVGAVIVKDEKLVGKGYHRYFGGPHAEIEAISKAKERAKGATLFVNLEPCSHFGKTPPCTEAIIKAGIKKVVVATIDPNPLNCGKGIKILKKAGLKVEVGVCEEEAKKLNEAFFKYIKEKIPYVIVKAAASLDGKIATFRGESKWITGERSRRLGKKLRDKVDAILVGINTVVRDDPILDSKLKVPLEAKVLENQTSYPTLIFTTSQAGKEKIKFLREKGVRVKIVKDKEGKIDLKEVLKELGKRGIASVLVEGGGEIIGSFVQEGLVDKILLFLSPRLIGGRKAPTWVEGEGFGSLSETPRINISRLRKVEKDILLEGYPNGKNVTGKFNRPRKGKIGRGEDTWGKRK